MNEKLKDAGKWAYVYLEDTQAGNKTIRFSYARGTNDKIEGVKRLKKFMNK